MKIIFQINGGIGKNIAATAVCKAINTKYPDHKLIVLTAYPEVFLCNPNVHKALNSNDLNYFYKDYIEGGDAILFLHDPYLETDFITHNGHLIAVWCRMFGLPYNGEMPELFLTATEQQFHQRLFPTGKPIFLLQTNGGMPSQPNKYSWTRDIPRGTAQTVVDAFRQDYHIAHIRREDQPALEGTIPVHADFRTIAVLIQTSAKRLFIDSFAQHAAAALHKPSVVCWVGNSPTQFGYTIHANVVATAPTVKPELRQSVYTKYDITGQQTEFPYNDEGEIFNPDIIINVLKDYHNVFTPKARVYLDAERGSMVARRLSRLLEIINLPPVTQIMDIGSWHLGQSIELARIFPTACIDAFEPVPASYKQCLERHSALPDVMSTRIHVHNLALSDAVGEVNFYPVDTTQSQGIDMGFSSLFKFKEGLEETGFAPKMVQSEITVQSDTLDNWCIQNDKKHIDIIWIDVQGAELLVFKGGAEILKNTKVILTEVGLKAYYEGHTLKADIDEFLSTLGFVELAGTRQANIAGYELNTIYVNKNLI